MAKAQVVGCVRDGKAIHISRDNDYGYWYFSLFYEFFLRSTRVWALVRGAHKGLTFPQRKKSRGTALSP